MGLLPEVMNAFLKELTSDELQVSADQPGIRPQQPEADTCLDPLVHCSLLLKLWKSRCHEVTDAEGVSSILHGVTVRDVVEAH